MAQGPVALELRFAEELVERRLVRECGVLGRVVQDVRWLVAGQCGFDVDENPGDGLRVDVLVVDLADRAVPAAEGPLALPDQGGGVDLDPHAEVGAALADQAAEVEEIEVRVGPRIADQDETAAPAYQFVDAEVLEVSPVGEVDVVFASDVGAAEELVDEIRAHARPGFAPTWNTPDSRATSRAER